MDVVRRPDGARALPRWLRGLPLAAILAGSALGGVAIWLFVRDHYFSLYDDAYIYLRYVQNVRQGCGLRFNCEDPPVEGFTSPLYLALLIAGSLATTRLVFLTQVICTLALGATLVAAVSGAASTAFYGPPEGDDRPLPARDTVVLRACVALAVGAVLGLDHYVMVNAVVGLETPVSALVVTLAWLAVLGDRRRTAVALVILAFLARPEGLLMVAFLPLLRWARAPRVLATLATAVAAITLARLLLFHDFVPNTYWVKAGGTSRHVVLGARYVGRLLTDHFQYGRQVVTNRPSRYALGPTARLDLARFLGFLTRLRSPRGRTRFRVCARAGNASRQDERPRRRRGSTPLARPDRRPRCPS
jgi:hypothetical protein